MTLFPFIFSRHDGQYHLPLGSAVKFTQLKWNQPPPLHCIEMDKDYMKDFNICKQRKKEENYRIYNNIVVCNSKERKGNKKGERGSRGKLIVYTTSSQLCVIQKNKRKESERESETQLS